jgi:uncharacterized SAM-dependent methyltransferase
MNQFAHEVRSGLGKAQKELPSKYLYDELGSALFDAITALPEYGLTRADRRLLNRHAGELPREFLSVAEFGSGSGSKTRSVLAALRPKSYFPIDVSRAALDHCAKQLLGMAEIEAMEASYLDGLDAVNLRRESGPLLILFLGVPSGISMGAAGEIFYRRFASV